MDDKTHNHSDHVHAKLSSNYFQVLDCNDFSTDEASNTQRGVPGEKKQAQAELILAVQSQKLNKTQTGEEQGALRLNTEVHIKK